MYILEKKWCRRKCEIWENALYNRCRKHVWNQFIRTGLNPQRLNRNCMCRRPLYHVLHTGIREAHVLVASSFAPPVSNSKPSYIHPYIAPKLPKNLLLHFCSDFGYLMICPSLTNIKKLDLIKLPSYKLETYTFFYFDKNP